MNYIEFVGGFMDGAKIKFEKPDQCPGSMTIHGSITKDHVPVILNGEVIEEFGMVERDIDHVYNIEIIFDETTNFEPKKYFSWNPTGKVEER